MQRGLGERERNWLFMCRTKGGWKEKGQTREIQHKPEQTWHYSCNLRQLSQDLYTWSHVTQAGNERQGSRVVVIKEAKPGAAPLALNDTADFLGWLRCLRWCGEEVKQTFFESISLRFIVNGADPRFVLRWHQIRASVLRFLALLQEVAEGTKVHRNTEVLSHI